MLGRFSLPRLRHSLQSEVPWGLRPAFTQCFQEGVTEPWLPWIWREKREGQRDLDLEQGKGGSKEGREVNREHSVSVALGFWSHFRELPPRDVGASGLWHCPALACGHATCFSGQLVILGLIAVTTGRPD